MQHIQLYLLTVVCSGICSTSGSGAWLTICSSERSSLGEAAIVGAHTDAMLVETEACSAGVLDTKLGCSDVRNWCQAEAINTDSSHGSGRVCIYALIWKLHFVISSCFILVHKTCLITMQGCPSWGEGNVNCFLLIRLLLSVLSSKDVLAAETTVSAILGWIKWIQTLGLQSITCSIRGSELQMAGPHHFKVTHSKEVM